MTAQELQDLQKLYNTMLLIETKGKSTEYMGDCLKFLDGFITTEQNNLTEHKED